MNKIRDIEFKHSSFITLHLQLHNQLLKLIHLGNWPHGSYNSDESQLANPLINRNSIQLALQQAALKILDSDLTTFKICCFSGEPLLLISTDLGSNVGTDDDYVVFGEWLREEPITSTQLSSLLYRRTDGLLRR